MFRIFHNSLFTEFFPGKTASRKIPEDYNTDTTLPGFSPIFEQQGCKNTKSIFGKQ